MYDYIVVGGGTAGAVVAARLSADRETRVLLLEAGPDYPDEIPGELLDCSAAVTAGHNWDMEAIVAEADTVVLEQMARISRVFQMASAHLASGRGVPTLPAERGGSGPRFPYPMGKVMGGGSAINGGLAFHARPEDYAAWTSSGNDRWSWDQVQPYIDAIEGAGGEKLALPIDTPALSSLTRCQEDFFETCLEMGHVHVDVRQGTASGVGMIPKNVYNAQRVSTASLYLAAARRRPNLTIRSRCLVDKLILERQGDVVTAAGVEALVDGQQRCRFSGGQIVLAAGTINSPAILLRSGIGAVQEIIRAGGKPLLDLPGVGKNLMDHPAVSIWAVPKAGACFAGEPVHQVMLQQRSAASGGLCDLQLFMLSALPTAKLPPLRDVVGTDVAIGISVVVANPSSRGHVEILDADPTRSPRIFLNCLTEASDLDRMIEGLRSAWRVLQGVRLQADVDRVVLWNQSIIDSDRLLERQIRITVRGTWHPVGTLRMGREGDAIAVVDQYGGLYGSSNVTVADGSIMPIIPSVPTNLTCMLIGERIAAHLRGLDSK